MSSAMHLPRLFALPGYIDLVDEQSSFPLDVWQRLEYIKTQSRLSCGLRSDYMQAFVTCVSLSIWTALNPHWNDFLFIN